MEEIKKRGGLGEVPASAWGGGGGGKEGGWGGEGWRSKPKILTTRDGPNINTV